MAIEHVASYSTRPMDIVGTLQHQLEDKRKMRAGQVLEIARLEKNVIESDAHILELEHAIEKLKA